MRKLVLVTIALLIAACAASAAVPPMISYQGKLMQPSGAPVPDGTYSMQSAIYDVPTGGTALWSETNPSVQVKGGLFATMLGSVVNLPANIFDSPNRWFGVKVGADPEMTPRQQVASSAFAFRAAVAGTVDDGAITTGKIADGAVTTAKVADGAVTDAKIAGVSGPKVSGVVASATYASSAGDADTVDGVHASSIVTRGNGVAMVGTGWFDISASGRIAITPSQLGMSSISILVATPTDGNPAFATVTGIGTGPWTLYLWDRNGNPKSGGVSVIATGY